MKKQFLLIVDHGSTVERSNQLLHEMASLIQERCRDMTVRGAHMSLGKPSFEDAVATALSEGADSFVVFPYMLLPGRHAISDMSDLVARAAAAYPHARFVLSQPFGIHGRLAEVVLERVSSTTVQTSALR